MKKFILKLLLLTIFSAFFFSSCDKTPPWDTKYHRAGLDSNWIPNYALPDVATIAPEDVTTSSALIGGKVNSEGDGPVTSAGICWSISPSPTTADSYIEFANGTLPFSEKLDELAPGTTYYYRAFAKNLAGTAYGQEFVVVTSTGTVSDIDGNTYQTVRIGNQVWMRENLRTTRYADGARISGMSDYVLDEDYGHHYSYEATVRTGIKNPAVLAEIQGVCPTGWHVPSDKEWKDLIAYTGVQLSEIDIFGLIGSDQGEMFKEAGTKHWTLGGGNNTTGFTALPAGICTGCELTCISTQTGYWSSDYWVHYCFTCDSKQIERKGSTVGENGFSVRCIQNSPNSK